MSFTPAVSDFPNSVPPTVGQNPDHNVGALKPHLAHGQTKIVNTSIDCDIRKMIKRRMARVKKARARLRQRNRVRAHAVRNN